MNTYLIVKTLHIISATLMVGTGFGTAFYLFWANRSGSVAAQSVVSHWVIKADWWFTTPAVIFQPLSGLWMLYERGYTVSTMLEQNWVWMTLGLYILAGICWLPVVWLQIRMAKIAEKAHKENADTIPEPYWRYARRWELLGYPAFCATIVIYFLLIKMIYCSSCIIKCRNHICLDICDFGGCILHTVNHIFQMTALQFQKS